MLLVRTHAAVSKQLYAKAARSAAVPANGSSSIWSLQLACGSEHSSATSNMRSYVAGATCTTNCGQLLLLV
jgi:glyceraldehyde-3-phosphate dehydrogenase/erythrose-4-phosphate dehydrogenase